MLAEFNHCQILNLFVVNNDTVIIKLTYLYSALAVSIQFSHICDGWIRMSD